MLYLFRVKGQAWAQNGQNSGGHVIKRLIYINKNE